jgi:outer membrane protein OmpA-like peptidoglycan-associated protein
MLQKNKLVALALVASFAALACGSPPISPELRTARDAYEEAKQSPAAELAPADLDSARQALDRAEDQFRKDHKGQAVKDYSYVAQRSAEYAVVAGLIEKEKRDRKQLKEKLDKLEKSRANMTREELEAARNELAEKKRQIADQAADLNKTAAQLEEERKLRVAAEGKLSAALTSLKEIGNIKEEKRGVVITLSGSVLFATGKHELLPIAEEKLAEVAKALSDQGYKRIVVEGHTDSRGSDSNNEELSLKRATSVRAFLVSKGIGSDKIVATGLGETRPVASNDSPEGRANNRRVELIVTPE